MKITIEKIPAEGCGDWHDKPLRWAVTGPGSERQKFARQADARAYLQIRRQCKTDMEAIRIYAAKP
jgi:hypothetical protein